MVILAQLASAAIYLLPLAVVLALHSRRERRLDELAALIPATVAVDLLAVLLLCRIMRLELAAFVGRALWIGGGALWSHRLRRRGSKLALPSSLDRRALVGIALAVAVALVLSLIRSRPFAIWDRELHIPFVGSLRGQHIPFANAYEPGVAFHYHFAGDVLASMLQIFSFDVIHASLALSLAHDVMFALIAATVGLAMVAARPKAVHVVVLGVGAVLLSGPCIFRFGIGDPFVGYSYYALYVWGFRPHQHIAMLMLAGIATVLVGHSRAEIDPPQARPDAGSGVRIGALVAMMSLLPITDETSAAMVGLCLAIAWLVHPTFIAATRRRGAWLLGAMALAFVATNLVFAASLAHGGPVQKVSFVAPRSPGVQQPPLPLSGGPGWVALVADTVPVWAIMLAVILLAARRDKGGDRPTRGFIAFTAALAVLSIVGLTTLDINGAPPESHRFLTAALFLFPLFGVLDFDRWPPGSLGRTLVMSALTLGAISGLFWLSHSPRHPTPEWYFQQRGQNLHTCNCRTIAGAERAQAPAVTYVESSVFYSYVGCRPSFVAGKRSDYWAMKQRPTTGAAGLQQLDTQMVDPNAAVDAICPTGRPPGDVDSVCVYALAHTTCTPEGTDFVRCPLSPTDRRAILGHPAAPR